jgi:putative sterol carrier protein
MADTVKVFFSELPSKVDASKAGGMNATFQFDITGDGGGKWYAKIAGGKVDIVEGAAENPTIILSAKDADWLDLVNGKINGQTAFLTGKLKIQGDMTLAMKLESLFQLG